MKGVAWVFARGGSKGLPGKNIKPLAGKPLIAWSIELARSTGCFDAVFVSTDDEEIAGVAAAHGAEIPFMRPAELATDTASEWLAWQHAARWQQLHYPGVEGFTSLPATSPLRTTQHILEAVSLAADHDLVLGITPAPHHPAFNMVRVQNSQVSLWDEQAPRLVRRQDAERAYNITTVVYATRVAHVLAASHVLEGNIGYIEVAPLNAVDIDTGMDFLWAQWLLEQANVG
ncbi:cytidylyltransferase domain-containing protein [Saccharospirillum alexandrii]|uniref:acylneuraminate cytidylyltransferase family protein n=1 Tax=Saccharospirillum alexandrii TaxID=2448477 RepID=UPI0037359788